MTLSRGFTPRSFVKFKCIHNRILSTSPNPTYLVKHSFSADVDIDGKRSKHEQFLPLFEPKVLLQVRDNQTRERVASRCEWNSPRRRIFSKILTERGALIFFYAVLSIFGLILPFPTRKEHKRQHFFLGNIGIF
jgi:hypothetical protein